VSECPTCPPAWQALQHARSAAQDPSPIHLVRDSMGGGAGAIDRRWDRAVWGSTVLSSTVWGSTVWGSAVWGSTVLSSTVWGSAVWGSTVLSSTVS
jgi:hypothetical protein